MLHPSLPQASFASQRRRYHGAMTGSLLLASGIIGAPINIAWRDLGIAQRNAVVQRITPFLKPRGATPSIHMVVGIGVAESDFLGDLLMCPRSRLRQQRFH
jgi:hypothetical protein